jgi:hypothetical protein
MRSEAYLAEREKRTQVAALSRGAAPGPTA